LKQIGTASQQLNNADFIVIDVILQQHILTELSQLLLESTIWFDSTNGECFVSHFDDGLVYPQFKMLAKVRKKLLFIVNIAYIIYICI